MGSVTDKVGANLTLTIANVSLQPGDLLLAGLVYDSGEGAPIVKWGQRVVRPVETISGSGLVTKVNAFIYNGAVARTRDLVATWASTAPTAKVMLAAAFTADSPFGIKDIAASQLQAATADPNSGTAVLTNEDGEVLWGIFGSEGPSSDTVGSVQNGWSSGQRAGTVGSPPASNITAHEVYKIITAAESAQASKTGATARDFNTAMATFRYVDLSGRGVSSSDIAACTEIFEAAGLDTDNMTFFFNEEDDRLECIDSSGPTLKAYYSRTDGWTTV